MNKTKQSWRIAMVLAAAALASAGGCIEGELGHGKQCEYDGERYRVGETFPATDGCNTCRCGERGDVECTLIACPPQDAGPGQGCEYDGKRYSVGETFPANDGCNSCSCGEGGDVQCTLIACPPQDAGAAQGCQLGNITIPNGEGVICPDGCNSCGCNDGQLIQTLKACAPLPQIEICDGPAPPDAPAVEPLYLAEDALALAITYGGGCETHTFRLCTDGSFLESNPVQLRVWVKDEGPPDPCLALPTEEKVFDLSPIRSWYERNYQTPNGTVIVNTSGGSVSYSF
jgi:hypothetical protein